MKAQPHRTSGRPSRDHLLLPIRSSGPRTAVRPLRRGNRAFNSIAASVVGVMIAGWAVSIFDLHAEASPAGMESGHSDRSDSAAPGLGRTITSALLDPRTETTAYFDEALLGFIDSLRGSSGKLRATFRIPGEDISRAANADLAAEYIERSGRTLRSKTLAAPKQAGIYKIALEFRRVRHALDDLSLITLVPFAAKRQGRIGLYFLGQWPFEGGGTPRSPAYENPRGFIEVTEENKFTYVSENFQLADFLTKDQPKVWPKYLLLEPKLLDKLELVIAELRSSGYNVEHLHVMSGFRTPRYNHSGGNTSGRANLSRHMYGDAADVFVDNDRDGMMDDLNRDGRADQRDAELLAAKVENVERRYPALLGGVGIYAACCGHGPFTHIDVRGYRARWRGTGNG